MFVPHAPAILDEREYRRHDAANVYPVTSHDLQQNMVAKRLVQFRVEPEIQLDEERKIVFRHRLPPSSDHFMKTGRVEISSFCQGARDVALEDASDRIHVADGVGVQGFHDRPAPGIRSDQPFEFNRQEGLTHGMRETPKRAANSSCLRRVPGGNEPDRIAFRSAVAARFSVGCRLSRRIYGPLYSSGMYTGSSLPE